MAFGSPGAFPIPSLGGPIVNKFRQMQPDWDAITDRHEYEDSGVSFVAANDTAPIYFILEYTGLSAANAALLYAHYNDAGKELFGFSFTIPRSPGTVFSGVHYAPDGWDEDHVKTHNNRIKIRLVKYPA